MKGIECESAKGVKVEGERMSESMIKKYEWMLWMNVENECKCMIEW